MDELLQPVTTVKRTAQRPSQPNIIEVLPEKQIHDFDSALEVLKDTPTPSQLKAVLNFLVSERHNSQDAKAAKIANILIGETIPDWWEQLSGDPELLGIKTCLKEYLCEVTALSSLVARLRTLTMSCRSLSHTNDLAPLSTQLKILLEVLETSLSSYQVVQNVYSKCMSASTRPRQEALWKEFVSLISSGRLLSAVAEAENVCRQRIDIQESSWLNQGDKYCAWLAQNVAIALMKAGDSDNTATSALAPVIGKALSLGYQDSMTGSLLKALLLHQSAGMKRFKQFMKALPGYQQRNVLLSVVQYVDRECLRDTAALKVLAESLKPADIVNDCAALIKDLIDDSDMLTEYLTDLCVNVEQSVLIRSFNLRRVIIAALSEDEEQLTSVMEKTMAKFGDQLFIRHAPTVQQEAMAQMVLISSGYIHRCQPMLLFTIAKSSIQTHGISNRLKASSQRAQWLGMIVGMTLSELTDKPGSRLMFEDEAMQTPEAKWYQALVKLHDKIGNSDKLRDEIRHNIDIVTTMPVAKARVLPMRSSQEIKNTSVTNGKPRQQTSRIIELVDDEDDEDDDIVPYAKPDSDPEDEEEDPTLVERNKPKPPVYIRDLIAGLRDTESYDRHLIALETSSSLIRRKASFGKEVSDHAVELMSVLMNLNDNFEMDNFLELRQEALISLLVAQPKIIAPFLAQSCFEGNYSVQQRAAMFTALALGARELAGYKDEDRSQAPEFPTKELPKHLQQIYGEKSRLRLTKASEHLEQGMVQPLALQAADKLSGPNALKVRTFSSRIDVQKKSTKIIKNALAQHIAEWFFFPLVGGWWAQMQSFGGRSITFSKHLLPLYLRTLAVVLHASGPSTLSLPQMTTEFWDLLLSFRTNTLNENEVPMLHSLLFAFLTLLELNEDKQRLANEHAKELVETQEWAKLVLDRYGSVSEAEEDESGKIKMLAAAIVVKCHEVVERWQRLMLGDLVDI